MPPPKPSNADVIAAINELSLTFGAELAASRAEVVALTTEVIALKELMKLKPPFTSEATIAAVIESVPMPPELGNLHPLSKFEVDLIKSSKKIDAIKAYRARIQVQYQSYVGLKEAKDLVCYVADHMTGSKPMFDASKPVPMTQEQKALVHAGKKIDAIKDYRWYVGTICAGMCGLKEAKDVIDAYEATLNVEGSAYALVQNEIAHLHYVPGQGVQGKFDAVKAYRHRTGAAYESAIKAVDKYIASKSDTYWVLGTISGDPNNYPVA